ncbi:MAG: aspartate decarboxylase [Halioglobus sp.]|nr:aspartate decarboxylase [Halioglobus sp.]
MGRPGIAGAAMSLWLCLRFERLPLECLSRCEDTPVVVLAAQRVLCANDCAAALGVRPGMGSATVRALVGDGPLQLLQRDTAAEQRSLQQLCCWGYGITPNLHTWREDCLLLEIGGCLGLFNGLEALLREVASGTDGRGYRACRALGPTPKAAWLLSFAAPETAMDPARPLQERLAPLPLDRLDEFPGTVDSLRRAGLHTLGDILALPPPALGRRCGRDFSDYLQQVLGQREDLRADYRPPLTFCDEYWFGYEVKTNGELLPAVQRLLQSLCRFLRNTQLRCTRITWRLVGIDGSVRDVDVGSASSHSDRESWYQLSRIRFEQLSLTGGVEGLGLECRQLLPGELDNIDLFSPRSQREPLAALLDRLRNRLGLQAVQGIGCRDEHLPELAVAIGGECTGQAAPPGAQRPFWLLPEPRGLRLRDGRLHWRGALQLLYGPERIEDNWWREAVSRDYYIATGRGGQHYWVFRDRLAGQWYLHGIFA